MSGLLRRIRRPGAAEETRTEAIALPEPAHGSAPDSAPVRADGRPLPAGVAADDLEHRGGAGRRGKLRRRVRFLRRARELALRDLGGLVYEAHRRDQDGGTLVKEKVQHLGVIDEELNGLEAELVSPRGATVLREPGVGGTCPRCRELHASDAHFCSRCGVDLTALPAEPATTDPPAEERPTTDLAPTTDAPAGNGRASTEDAAAAPDHDRSA
ncbi:MAG: zinc ribbon domain-containing protein [Solirubrobacteraceae bacterium]